MRTIVKLSEPPQDALNQPERSSNIILLDCLQEEFLKSNIEFLIYHNDAPDEDPYEITFKNYTKTEDIPSIYLPSIDDFDLIRKLSQVLDDIRTTQPSLSVTPCEGIPMHTRKKPNRKPSCRTIIEKAFGIPPAK